MSIAAELGTAQANAPPTGDRLAELEHRAQLGDLGSLGDAELLAVLIGRGGRRSTRIAERTLDRVGGLVQLPSVGLATLLAVQGVSRGMALRVRCACELAQRRELRRSRPRPPLHTPDAVAELMAPRLLELDHEQMWVLSLDGSGGLRGLRQVARGGQHGCSVRARDILRAALCDAASGFVLVHNHPSGDPTPSREDVAMTLSLARAADVVGVPVLDHLVVASGGHVSLLERGWLEEGPRPRALDAASGRAELSAVPSSSGREDRAAPRRPFE
jgi:DNA repair protein RadC